MARPMIELFWEDGRVTRIPDHNVKDLFGKNVQPELEIRFDDLSDGIWLQLRHSGTVRPEPGDHSAPDPRGMKCAVFADAVYEIATRKELEDLSMLYYEGRPWVFRYGGGLVSLGKVHALADTYVGGRPKGSILGEIASVADAVALLRDEEDDERLAEEMGVPVALLKDAYAAADAWGSCRDAGVVDEEQVADFDFS